MMDNFDLRKYLAENKLTANSKLVNEAETGMDMAKKQLDDLGVKYEMSATNKVNPFKVIYLPVNKSDEFYDKFDEIVDLFNLKGVVKSEAGYDYSSFKE